MRITPLTCTGDARSMGRQYGEARAKELAQALAGYFAMFAALPGSPDRAVLIQAASKLKAPALAAAPQDMAFMQGQAEGASIAFNEFFAMQCFLEVMFNYHVLPAMCTSFAVTGPATKAGETLVGQNVDWFLYSSLDLLRLEYPDGSRSLALCLLGIPIYQMTSHGLCNSANLTVGPPMTAPPVPFAVYLPKAMREPTVEGAMAVLKNHVQGLGYFHVADAAGTMLGIESVPGRHVLLRPENGVLSHANSYEAPEFKVLDQGHVIMPDSPLRAARIRERVAQRHGEITVEVMQEIMRDHSGHPCSICRHPDPAAPELLRSESLTSVIMAPGRGVMWVTSGPPCENEYQEFQL